MCAIGKDRAPGQERRPRLPASPRCLPARERGDGRRTAHRLGQAATHLGRGLAAFGLLLAAAGASAQQQLDAPPDARSSPLIQPADVVQTQCPEPLAHVPAGSSVGSGDWVELQRSACRGSCPAYTVRLYGSGAVEWHGESHVAVPGDASAQLDPGSAANLIQQLRDHGFNSLCGDYKRPVTDMPTYRTAVSIAGSVFRVSDYALSAPAWLRDFDERIDATADTHRWRHGDPSRELFGGGNLGGDARLPKPGRTRLMRAAATPGGAVQLLLAQKVAIEAEDASGWTALMYAAGAGSLDQVRQLLAAGANAAHLSRAGETLLFAAAGSTEQPVAKLLLLQRSGANVAAVSSDGNTVLAIAVDRYWQPEILKTLLAMGANPRIRNSQGRTALDALEQARQKTDVPEAYAAARAMLLQTR